MHPLRPAGLEAIEGAGLDQPLDRGSRNQLEIDTLAEIEEVPVGPSFLAGADDLLGGAAANPLDGGESKENLALGNRELDLAGVNIGG